MRQITLLAAATLAIVLATETTSAQRVYKVDKEFNGSAAPIAMDLNNDGIPAIRAIGGGSGFSMPAGFRPTFRSRENPSKGAFHADLVSEAAPVEQPTGKCDPEEVELETIHYSSVHRYWNGDLLLSNLIEGFSCLNPLTGVLRGVIRLEHTGGTGIFAGAQGETIREFEGQALDPSGLRLMMMGKETGELILPGP